jgi:cephalosporin-C deacetylase-like acetyl esterase
MRKVGLFVSMVGLLGHLSGGHCQAQNVEKGKSYLEWMLRTFPKSEAWEKWLQETGELPPDFDAMPSIAGLPDPFLKMEGDRQVRVGRTRKEWRRRREELLGLFEHYVIGTYPPPPGNVRGEILSEQQEAGATVRDIQLEFGLDHRAKLWMQLIIPKGEGPFPVFLTQHNHRGWALVAVSRGYIGCVYAGSDSRDDTGPFAAIWPDCDWTKLTRRAWAASRCIDYLSTLPIVNEHQIVMTGHSRNGKMSIIAAAIDERIGAVISSSSGAGGACTYRFFSEAHFGEGIELITRVFPDWLHPRLRFFAGREDKLPIDQHELIACIAPRACLISTALNDNVESTWAIQETYLSAKRVYEFLGAGDRLHIRWRHGTHETRAEDIEAYLDWLDYQFGRKSYRFPEEFVYPRYSDWLRLSGERIRWRDFPEYALGDLLETPAGAAVTSPERWKSVRGQIVERICWSLGEAPSVAVSGGGRYGSEQAHISMMLGRHGTPTGIEKRQVNFGNYIAGDIYFPSGADKKDEKRPAIIWLHPHSFSNGYIAGYRRGESAHLAMAREGFVVFAYDQIGNGSRIEEATRFYERYPRWSLLGKMIADARAAVDLLENVPYVDGKRIFLLGYGLGGMVALHTAALDERVAGVVSVAGFTPMRLDSSENGTGFVESVSRWHVLQPRLGFFVGHERRIPYDYHQVLALLAPRPLLIVAPKHDREHRLADVEACLNEVRKAYELLQARKNLELYIPDDYNRFSPELQHEVYTRLKRIAGL